MQIILSSLPPNLEKRGYKKCPSVTTGGKAFFYVKNQERDCHRISWDRLLEKYVYTYERKPFVVVGNQIVANMMDNVLDEEVLNFEYFTNSQERDLFFHSLSCEKLEELKKYYSSFPERTRVPYAQWMLDGIKKILATRNILV